MRKALLHGLLALFLVTIVSVVLYTFKNRRHRAMPMPYHNAALLDEAKQKIILLWTPFFGESDYLKIPSELKCEESRCMFTSNRSFLTDSDALVFHSADIVVDDLPKTRNPQQLWIWHNLESPLNSRVTPGLNGLMNWTATYRRDSDIWTPYGVYSKYDGASSSDTTVHDYSVNKTKMAVWFVSNCHTGSNREGYVAEMRKTISVDTYGGCGDRQCLPKMSFECYHMAGETYRFYLAFENSYCRDYVTEKLFHSLQTNMIPVVFGDGRYSNLAPEGSYIDVAQFRSPQELAEYLLKLAANDTLYNSYFDWKRHYRKGGYHWSCELCKRLHQNQIPSTVYDDLEKWWYEAGICKRWQLGEFVTYDDFR